jgi:hypothetical protein
MDVYPRIPPAPVPRRRFSLRTMFLGMAVAALLISLMKAGAFLAIAGVLSTILLLIGVALTVSRFSAVTAGALCAINTVVVLVLGVALSEGRYTFRSRLSELLGERLGDKENVDIIMLWICTLGMSVILGSALGWALAKSEEQT